MACITTDRKTTLEADLARVIKHIAAMETALDGPTLSGTKSYSWDSGAGRASEVFESPMIMIRQITVLEAKRDRIIRALNGGSLLRTQVRR